MQQFEPSQETTSPELAAPPARVDEELEALAAQALTAEPRRDVRGWTLDEALLQDRQTRDRILRRARQVVSGMQFCTSTMTLCERATRGSWVPLTKFLHSLAPRTAEQSGLFVLGLCFCWAPLFYVGSLLAVLGLAGSLLGLSIWTLAIVTRAALGVYLRHLVPW